MEKINLTTKQNFIIKVAAWAAIFVTAACNQVVDSDRKSAIDSISSEEAKRTIVFKEQVLPAALQLIDHGDIVTRMGTDITSLLLSKLNPTDPSFSHCGILSIENDTAFVYHALGGEANPGQKMKREPLEEFAKPADCKNLGIFSPTLNETQRVELTDFMKAQYLAGLPFDTDFDLTTQHRQYCTELVAKSLAKITGSPQWIKTLHIRGRHFIPVEFIYNSPFVSEKNRYQY